MWFCLMIFMQYGEVSYVIVSSKKNGSAVVELKSVASAVSIQSFDINSFFNALSKLKIIYYTMSYCYIYKDYYNLMDDI